MKIRVVKMKNGDYVVQANNGFPTGTFINVGGDSDRFKSLDQAQTKARQLVTHIRDESLGGIVDSVIMELDTEVPLGGQK